MNEHPIIGDSSMCLRCPLLWGNLGRSIPLMKAIERLPVNILLLKSSHIQMEKEGELDWAFLSMHIW
jgi:hypothetical protein